MNYLITGGCGYLGTALIKQLTPFGCNVRVVDNLTTGKRHDLSIVAPFTEIPELLVNILESEGVSGVKLTNSEKRLGDVMRNYSDTTKARTRLGWQPKMTLNEGLLNTVRYFLKDIK